MKPKNWAKPYPKAPKPKAAKKGGCKGGKRK